MSVFGWIKRNVPLVGPVVSNVELAIGESSIQEAIFDKLCRGINAGAISAGIVTGPLAGIGLGFLIGFINSEAVQNGTLEAEINKLSDKDAGTLYGICNAHPLLMAI